ncbi:hypothetical protein NFC81_10320 [Salinispirillum sp. LH 10-3-1]|uniref:DUF885 domain-containing protein n=1 Tax=Salinispirillum sp. LH 10-3-1 TaxID=2952525 RepID=A0AB38YDH6_9GAMM
MVTLTSVKRAFYLAVVGAFSLVIGSALASAQSLEDRTISRWLETSVELEPFGEALDGILNEDDEDWERYTTLSEAEYYQLIEAELRAVGLYDDVEQVTSRFSWSSPGHFFRTGERIGLAMQAYFAREMMAEMPPEQAAMLADFLDPAVGDVPNDDINVIERNWDTILAFIEAQGYLDDDY